MSKRYPNQFEPKDLLVFSKYPIRPWKHKPTSGLNKEKNSYLLFDFKGFSIMYKYEIHGCFEKEMEEK